MLALMYYSSPTNDGGLVCTYNKLRLMVPLMFSIEGALSNLLLILVSYSGYSPDEGELYVIDIQFCPPDSPCPRVPARPPD